MTEFCTVKKRLYIHLRMENSIQIDSDDAQREMMIQETMMVADKRGNNVQKRKKRMTIKNDANKL